VKSDPVTNNCDYPVCVEASKYSKKEANSNNMAGRVESTQANTNICIPCTHSRNAQLPLLD